jgi:protein-S-isoprenylcysteine O-methyltransferase Ste14
MGEVTVMPNRNRTLWHHGPSWLWLISFGLVIGVDAMIGRWLLLPVYVAGFYGGMVVIDLVTYPFLERWRRWLRPRGLRAWYIVEVGVIWIGTTVVLALLSPTWLSWNWSGPTVLQVFGAFMMILSLGIGVWAAGQMGWARLLFAGALFPPGKGAEENGVPQFLVVRGPYRYVRNPLYDTDMLLILGTALFTQNLGIVILLLAYIAQLVLQLRLEEPELRARFGAQYVRYCARVPRFIPRLKPADPHEITG